MSGSLTDRNVAILAADGVQQVELTAPRQALREAGADVTLVSVKSGSIAGVIQDEKADVFPVDTTTDAASARDFDALVVPGGLRSTAALQGNKSAVELVRGFMEFDKPVAIIGDAARLLVAADAVKGRTLTSDPEIREAIEEAGGTWVDREVETDQKLLTGRTADDLAAFCRKLVTLLSTTLEERRLDRMVEQSFPASDPLPGPISLG